MFDGEKTISALLSVELPDGGVWRIFCTEDKGIYSLYVENRGVTVFAKALTDKVRIRELAYSYAKVKFGSHVLFLQDTFAHWDVGKVVRPDCYKKPEVMESGLCLDCKFMDDCRRKYDLEEPDTLLIERVRQKVRERYNGD
jgi:hypothetical protein